MADVEYWYGFKCQSNPYLAALYIEKIFIIIPFVDMKLAFASQMHSGEKVETLHSGHNHCYKVYKIFGLH